MNKRYILTIDSGNTFIKWGLHDRNEWILQGKIEQDQSEPLAQTWQDLPKPSAIIVSNVAGSNVQKKLYNLCSIWNTKPFWISSVRQQCGVYNRYSDPSQLGSDRWAALIAAWNCYLKAALVVNIGTAMTVDVLSDSGEFLGGFILPGPDLMFNALKVHTSIPSVERGSFHQLPVNTSDAIYSGVIQSMVCPIERIKQKLSMYLGYSVQNCIISGGASSLILPHLEIPVIEVNNLVLNGLLLIANDQLKRLNSV